MTNNTGNGVLVDSANGFPLLSPAFHRLLSHTSSAPLEACLRQYYGIREDQSIIRPSHATQARSGWRDPSFKQMFPLTCCIWPSRASVGYEDEACATKFCRAQGLRRTDNFADYCHTDHTSPPLCAVPHTRSLKGPSVYSFVRPNSLPWLPQFLDNSSSHFKHFALLFGFRPFVLRYVYSFSYC